MRGGAWLIILYACYFSVSRNTIPDNADVTVNKRSKFRAHTEGTSSFLLARLQGPIESVWLCGQVNDISLRVVFNHEQTNEIGCAGVTPAINSIARRSFLVPSRRFPIFLAASFTVETQEWRDLGELERQMRTQLCGLNRISHIYTH